MFEGIHSTIKPYSLEMFSYNKKIISSGAVKPVIPVWKTRKKTSNDKSIFTMKQLSVEKQIKLLEEFNEKNILLEELKKGKYIDVYI